MHIKKLHINAYRGEGNSLPERKIDYCTFFPNLFILSRWMKTIYFSEPVLRMCVNMSQAISNTRE